MINKNDAHYLELFVITSPGPFSTCILLTRDVTLNLGIATIPRVSIFTVLPYKLFDPIVTAIMNILFAFRYRIRFISRFREVNIVDIST